MARQVHRAIQNMEINNFDLGADEYCVLQYLKQFPEGFVTQMEICQRADGKNRFREDVHWAHNSLSRLLDLKLITADGDDRYRINTHPKKTSKGLKQFMAPQVRKILEQSGKKFDFSEFS